MGIARERPHAQGYGHEIDSMGGIIMRWFRYLQRAAVFAAGLALGLVLVGLASYLIGDH
jgi:hypothetical protein